MTATAEGGQKPRLLYITAFDREAGDNIIALESRINIGVLARYFDVFLAVVGPVGTVELNTLRLSLGAIRVTGGFESSRADRPAPRALCQYMESRLGSDILNARLQSVIQRKANDFDITLVDSLLAWPYRPVGADGPVGYIAHKVVTDDDSTRALLPRFMKRGLGGYQSEVLESADMVFAPLSVATELSELGVSMGALKHSFNQLEGVKPTLADVEFNLTAPRIGYAGYLGDAKNLASLSWFLDNVWSVASRILPDVELHIVGKAPSDVFRQRISDHDNIKLHWESDDQVLIQQQCRIVIEPLLFEDHIDVKLINAMARGIPTVTTEHAVKRAHTQLRPGIIAADSRENMVIAINRLMKESRLWKTAVRDSIATARPQLPAFELAHSIARELVRWHKDTAKDQ